MSCSKKDDNPFFSKFGTPFETPAFDKIKNEHYLPAFKAGIEQDSLEIAAIANNPADPTFENTLEALDRTGVLLSTVSGVFYNVLEANTNDTLQQISNEVAPLLSKHSDDILLNEKLFQRVKTVYDQRESLTLTPEQQMLLEKWYKDFVRGGANLAPEQKERMRKINEDLSVLTLKFGDNVLAETNAFELVIDNENDLSGLPATVISTAADAAKNRGKEGKWVFTLHRPSMEPFLQYSDKRDLREKIFKAYIERGNHDNEYDNKEIIKKITALRLERANLLGYATHADFVLEENMAKNPAAVYDLLNKLWTPAVKRAQSEVKELQSMIKKEGSNFKLQPWDWWYYAEKLRKAKYALDDEILRPYFQLENVRKGAFDVATKLYGISFIERPDIPVYNPDVKAFEVKEADGRHIGILYTDYLPRANKRSGAWDNSFRERYFDGNKVVTPIVVNCFNFSLPTGDTPSLLTLDEVETLFHEFGHGLHDLLTECNYQKVTGTNVPRDFVELPSQIMENWATHPEVLKTFAKHYRTGEPIPDELIAKIQNSNLFNQGFATVEFLAASYLDMDWHTITQPQTDVMTFENKAMQKIGLIPEIVVRYRSPYFQHIFAGGYSAGYYSYIWAEVLDADAFQAFEENGIFDPTTAKAFRENILAKGGSEDPMVLYKRFRGAEPKIDALLKRRGLN
jgi:peptidyl-dipeptidase Dcp